MNRDFTIDDLDVDPLTSVTADRMSADEVRERTHIVNGGEQALVTCPKCRGSGYWRPGYPCFTCKGKGKATTRQAGAIKAKATREANHQAWCEGHHDLLTTLGSMSDWNTFAASMLEQVSSGRALTENQTAACRRMFAKIEARREQKRLERQAEQSAKSGTVTIDAINALFARATDNDIKRPVFRAEGLEISKASPKGRNAGALYVKAEDDTYLGKIVGQQFLASREAPADTLEKLQAIATDPTAAAIRYARRTGRCGCCGHGLVDPVSIRAGIGPICAGNWGLDYRRELAREELQREAAEEQINLSTEE